MLQNPASTFHYLAKLVPSLGRIFSIYMCYLSNHPQNVFVFSPIAHYIALHFRHLPHFTWQTNVLYLIPLCFSYCEMTKWYQSIISRLFCICRSLKCLARDDACTHIGRTCSVAGCSNFDRLLASCCSSHLRWPFVHGAHDRPTAVCPSISPHLLVSFVVENIYIQPICHLILLPIYEVFRMWILCGVQDDVSDHDSSSYAALGIFN